MLTVTAKNDLATLRQQGCNPTDEEIIKLNDLALRIEQGKDTTPANMPRIGFAGNVVLYEPTIGAIQWWNDFGSDSAFTDDGRLMTYFFMLSNARNISFLSTLTTPRDIRNVVKKWMKTIDATEKELWRALMWVKYGIESPENIQKVNDVLSNEEAMNTLWYNLISTAAAIGVTPNDLKTYTQSELVSMLIQANMYAKIPMKKSVAEYYIAYRQLIKQIEEKKKVEHE